jgi:transposase
MAFTGRIYKKCDHRKTFEGILYRMRIGCPWRDIPEFFGDWSAIYRRFNLWSKKGILIELFKNLKSEPDLEWIFIDGTIVKAHQHCAGAVSDNNEAIGKSVAGNTTKIHMAVDSFGLPLEFTLTGGEVHDSKEATNLIKIIPDYDYIIADKGYDRLLGVKRNNFYSYQKRSVNKAVDPDHDEIIELLTRMAKASDHTYGERRMLSKPLILA